MSQLIIFFNVIYISSQASGPAQPKKEKQTRGEKDDSGKTREKSYKLVYLQKSCLSLAIFHFDLAVMLGVNCEVVGCWLLVAIKK